MKISNFIKTSILTLLVVFTACVDLEDTSFNIEETDTFFETEDDIKKGVVAIYDALSKGNYQDSGQGGVYDVATILTVSGTHTVWDTRTFGNNGISSQSKEIETIYLGSYFGIAKANLILEKVDEVEMEEDAKNHYIGEARFLRGLFYFNLVQYFGGVPLTTETYKYDYEASKVPRSTTEEVYNFIIEDFEFAEANLPLDDFAGGELATGRATASAASGLLAKVYLTMAGHPLNKGISHFQKAKDYAQKVIDLDIYKLIDDYATIFLSNNENNREWLFSVQFGPTVEECGNWGGWQNTKAMNGHVDTEFGEGYAGMTMTEEMSNAYNSEDPRFIYNVVDTDKKGKIEKKKFKWKTNKFRFVAPYIGRNSTEINAPVLRYADILLTLAEAENEINGPTELAYDAINQVLARARKGIPSKEIPASAEPADLAGLDQDTFRETVFWERARELMMEGLDRFDLMRSGNYYDVVKDAKHISDKSYKGFDPLPHFELLPLPLLAIRNNPALADSQNPGY